MFEVPNAKRVRREDLYGESSDEDDRAQDEAQDAEARAQLARLLGLDVTIGPEDTAKPGDDGEAAAAPAAEEEFEFRLFSAPDAAAAPPPKVVITIDEDAVMAANEEAWLGEHKRPLEHFLLGEPTGERKEAFEFAAVSGEDVLQGAQQRCWGLEVPWRVRRVVLSAKQLRALADHGWDTTSLRARGVVLADKLAVEGSDDRKRRKRPGKKRRIALRVQDKALKATKETEEKSKISKEEHLREKKKRLNREKKLKRRQKAKELKVAGGGSNADAGEDGSSG